MPNKVSIGVFEKGEKYREPGELIEVIHRKVWAENMGNFNPVFCRYNKKVYQVQSFEGDLSDPFRRTEEYLKHLFIEVAPGEEVKKNGV